MDEHIHAIRAALLELDHPPGSPAERALAELTRLQAAASQVQRDARRYHVVSEQLTRQDRHIESVKARHQLQVDRLNAQVKAHRDENQQIREANRVLIGETSGVIRSLRDVLTAHADQLIELTRKTP